jgi:Tfp pilus assembly major pilin PilA
MATQGMNKQRGITLLGFIMVLAVAGFFLFLGMRLVPVYVEYYSVVTDLKAICKEPGVATAKTSA